MILTLKDVERITRAGYAEGFFIVNTDGWLKLRNRDGRCVFHNGTGCTIYENRPEGCRSYPVVSDGDRVSLDEDCPHREEFEISDDDRERVIELVGRLRRSRR